MGWRRGADVAAAGAAVAEPCGAPARAGDAVGGAGARGGATDVGGGGATTSSALAPVVGSGAGTASSVEGAGTLTSPTETAGPSAAGAPAPPRAARHATTRPSVSMAATPTPTS